MRFYLLVNEALLPENLYDSAGFFRTFDDPSLSLGVTDVHELNISKLFFQHVEYRVVGLESHADASVIELNFFHASVRILDYEAVRLYFLQSCGRSLVYVVLIHQLLGKDTPSSVSGGGIAFASSRIKVKCGPCNNY